MAKSPQGGLLSSGGRSAQSFASPSREPLANLVASFIARFRLKREDLGIFITHAGLILLLLGQFLTQTFARETQMPLEIGQSGNYSISALKITE